MKTTIIKVISENKGIVQSKILLGFLIFFTLMLSGCISIPIPARYSAQNYIRTNGTLSLGPFHYIPADRGDLKPNEIKHNTMGGPIILSTSIAEYVKRANALELNKSGIQINGSSSYQLSAKINNLYADLLGFSVDWELDITYILTRKTDQSIVMKKPLHVELEAGKASYGSLEVYGQSIDELILKAYEQLISDIKFQELLGG